MPGELHNHNYSGRTTFNDGHIHGYSGVSSSNPDVPGHMHYMAGDTTFDDGHRHRYSLYTGPEIPVHGGHAHYFMPLPRLTAGTSIICTGIRLFMVIKK